MGLDVPFVFNSKRQQLQKLGLGFGHSKSVQAFRPAAPPQKMDFLRAIGTSSGASRWSFKNSIPSQPHLCWSPLSGSYLC